MDETIHITQPAGGSKVRLLSWFLAFSLGTLSFGCEGEISLGARQGPAGPRPVGSTCDSETPAPELRRLSSDQYRNTLRDLFPRSLGAELVIATSFPETVVAHGLATDAEANHVNEGESIQIEENAAELAELVAGRITDAMPCVTSSPTPERVDACIDTFISAFGERAYRRPLSASETALIRSVYDIGREESATAGFQSVVEFFLQSPALLYQIERGAEPVADHPNTFALSDYELATRLSYFLWNSTPDRELLQAAADGDLSRPEALEIQARRMVEDPRALDAMTSFHRDLTRSYRLDEVGLEDASFSEPMREAMQQEMRRYLEAMDARDALNFDELFSSNRYPIAPELAEIYGVDPAEADGSERAINNRRGILGLPSVMAAVAAEEGKDPTIIRALFILEDVLCQGLPSFPGNLDVSAPLEATINEPTARGRLEPTMTSAECSGCHQLINPPGFALEQYDRLGRHRLEQEGVIIDASGEMSLPGATGSFEDSVEFLEFIASSRTARSCYVEHWVRAALGRAMPESDQCTTPSLMSAWTASGGDLRELLVQIVLSESFRQRIVQEEAS